MSNHSKRLILVLAAVLPLLGSLIVVTASPAAAASPRCYTSVGVRSETRPDGTYGYVRLPIDNLTNYNWCCAMSKGGQQGAEAVRQLQNTLNQCYWQDAGRRVIAAPLRADGGYGSLTRDAVIAVQRYHGISADGVYGPQTAGTMFHDTWIRWPGGEGYGCWTVRQAGIE
jgi:hypothetical protein